MGEFDREWDALEEELNDGRITQREFNKRAQELERDRRDADEVEREEAHHQLDRNLGYDW